MSHVPQISSELSVRPAQVERTLELHAEGSTVPFIARYRKEATGNLDEVQIQAILDRAAELQELEERRAAILKSIDDQGKLTPELAAAIARVKTRTELEDLYLPYRPKRRTRATIAKERGLEPLAEVMWEGNPALRRDELIAPFVDASREVPRRDCAGRGARYLRGARGRKRGAAEVRTGEGHA